MTVAVQKLSEHRDSATRTAEPFVPAGRYDRVWALMMSAIDRILRRLYDVRSFTDHPDCLLRIARLPAPRPISLSDGTEIRTGDPIAVLHFWNEQMPPFAPGGPDLAWAKGFRRRMLISFRELSRYLAANPAWDDVRAIHGCVNFGSRRRRSQLASAAKSFGFELVAEGTEPGLHERGEDVLIWCLARAFNPAASRRHALWRDRTELWISRATLDRRYG